MVLAIISGLTVYVAVQDEHATQKSTQKTAYHKDDSVSGGVGSGTAHGVAKTDENHFQENIPNVEWHLPSWYGFFRWPNGTTTWAIILTLIVIADQTKQTAKAARAGQTAAEAALAQSHQMRKQTKILGDSVATAQKAADAAEISAKAAMGVAVPTLVLQEFAWGPIGEASPEDFLRIPRIKIAIKNYGQSPAFVRAYDVVFTLEELPSEPVYNEPPYSFDLDNIVVDSGAVYLLDEGKANPGLYLFDADLEGIREVKKILKIYGYVRYGDVFGSPDKSLLFCQYLDSLPTKDSEASFISLPSKRYTGQDDQNPN